MLTVQATLHWLDYPDLVKEAVTEALDDAGLKYENIQQATASYMYGGSCCGQRALYEIGLTGIPIFNLNNACARGTVDVMLAPALDDRANPADKHIQLMADTYGLQAAPITSQMFGNAGKEHMEKYGTTPLHFAKIAHKNHMHSLNNPKSQFQKEFSLDKWSMRARFTETWGCLSAAQLLTKNPRLKKQAVEIVGIELGTDEPSVFAEKSNIKMIGFDLIKKISERLYKNTGVSPKDVQVIELHDCFSTNELISYESLGSANWKEWRNCGQGDNTYGGKWVINPSGGLISKGHPIGATGIAQAVELSNQLRGRCGKRQVENCRYALQHNIGSRIVFVLTINLRLKTVDRRSWSSGTLPTKPILTLKTIDALFEEIRQRAAEEAQLAKQVNASYQGSTVRGENCDYKVDTEISLKDDDFIKLAAGQLKPDQAFMQGKMKIRAMKLKTILDPSKIKSRL
uniref:Sterol carrier protein 2 n=1 Tax=Ditylenchus dipsaci TaxID=166011 RepID=A0A915DUP9_9BILA